MKGRTQTLKFLGSQYFIWSWRLTTVFYMHCVLQTFVKFLELGIGVCGTLGAIIHYSWEWMVRNRAGKRSSVCWAAEIPRKKVPGSWMCLEILEYMVMHNTHSLCSYSQDFSREAAQHLLLLCKCKTILGQYVALCGCSQDWVGQVLPGASGAASEQLCSLQRAHTSNWERNRYANQ